MSCFTFHNYKLFGSWFKNDTNSEGAFVRVHLLIRTMSLRTGLVFTEVKASDVNMFVPPFFYFFFVLYRHVSSIISFKQTSASTAVSDSRTRIFIEVEAYFKK